MILRTFQQFVLPFLVLSLTFAAFNAGLRAEEYSVNVIGGWTAAPDNSLAKAFKELVAGSNHTINLGAAWTANASDWSDWASSGVYTLFKPTATLTAGQNIAIVLNGKTISGTSLELLTGLGKYTFSGGTLGDSADDFRIGVTGDAEVILARTFHSGRVGGKVSGKGNFIDYQWRYSTF